MVPKNIGRSFEVYATDDIKITSSVILIDTINLKFTFRVIYCDTYQLTISAPFLKDVKANFILTKNPMCTKTGNCSENFNVRSSLAFKKVFVVFQGFFNGQLSQKYKSFDNILPLTNIYINKNLAS